MRQKAIVVPTGFSDFLLHYLLERSYWQNVIVNEIAPRATPIIGYKLGRRQFGMLSPFAIASAMFSYELVVKHVINFVTDLIDWLLNFLSLL